MKILWLGALHSDLALNTRKAPNPAAAKWTRGLIGGLKTNGVEVLGLTHSYEQAWPKGLLFPGSPVDFDSNVELNYCRYINIKGIIRDSSLILGYRNKIRKIIRDRGIDAVVCYNVKDYPFHVEAMKVAHDMGVPCFPIILDGEDPREDQWKWLLEGTKCASGIVFLSDWMINNYPGKLPTLHLDGGCQAWYGEEGLQKREDNLVVYSGTLDHWRGLSFLVDVVGHLEKLDYKLVICGKSEKGVIQKLIKNDSRIDVKGFVSDEELHALSLRASVFINARDPKNGDNVLNFPSKLPNYLAYGKPIVSTWLLSLSPEYRSYLKTVDTDAPFIFASCIEEVLRWKPADYEKHMNLVKGWFLKEKLWSVQAERLKSWMEPIVSEKGTK
jgi:glycosyltransferase involved in cell wall biosynthesis